MPSNPFLRFVTVKRILCVCLCLLCPLAYAATLSEAEQLLNSGQYEKALGQLDRYLSKRPQDAGARFNKGLALVMLERDDEAIKVFSDLARDFPEMPEPFNNLAVLYARNGRYEEARDALESALVTHPSYATAHENLGDIYAALANAAYNRAIVLDKDNAGVQTKLDLIAGIQRFDAIPGTPAETGNRAVSRPASRPAPAVTSQAAIKPVIADNPISSAPAAVRSTSGADKKTGEQDAILQVVEAWRKGWSAQDVEAYLATYSPNFEPATGVDRSVWEAQRRTRVVRPRSIAVQVLNPKVFQGTSTYARVEFLQIYESNNYSDQVRKLLELEKRAGQWLIIGESVLN